MHPKNALLLALKKQNKKHVGQTLRKKIHLLLADVIKPKIK